LLSREHLFDPLNVAALEKSIPQMELGQLRGNVDGGNKVSAKGNDTAVNPAWRKAYSHLILTGRGYPDASPLRASAPYPGAYFNEVRTEPRLPFLVLLIFLGLSKTA